MEEGDKRGEKIREGVLIEMSRVFRMEVLKQIGEMRGPEVWKPDSLTEISEVRWGWMEGRGDFVENEMGGGGGEGDDVEEDCKSLVGDDVQEEDCESLVGEYDEEEEEEEEEEGEEG